eukprot:g122.t1
MAMARRTSALWDEKPERRRVPKKRKKKSLWQRMFPKYSAIDDMSLDELSGKVIDHLDLKGRDVQKLKLVYDDIDCDESGSIEYREFAKFCGERRNFFSDSLFRLIDKDRNNELSFNEFFQVISSYCLWPRDQILKFVFDTFDATASGQIEKAEFFRMVRHVNRKQNGKFRGNLQAALDAFERKTDIGDGMLDFAEFRALNNKFEMLLHPIFRLQDSMQKKTLGERRWRQVAQRKKVVDEIEAYKHAKVQTDISVYFNQTVSNSIELAVGSCAEEAFAAAMSTNPTVCGATAYDACTNAGKFLKGDVHVTEMCPYVDTTDPKQADFKFAASAGPTPTGPVFTSQTLFDYPKKTEGLAAWKSQFKLCMGRTVSMGIVVGVVSVTAFKVDKVSDAQNPRPCSPSGGSGSGGSSGTLGTNAAGKERQLRVAAVLAAAMASALAFTFTR